AYTVRREISVRTAWSPLYFEDFSGPVGGPFLLCRRARNASSASIVSSSLMLCSPSANRRCSSPSSNSRSSSSLFFGTRLMVLRSASERPSRFCHQPHGRAAVEGFGVDVDVVSSHHPEFGDDFAD